MATPTTISGFEELSNLEAPLRKIFYSQQDAIADPNSLLNLLFNVEDLTDEAQVQNQGVGGFENIPEYTPGGAIPATDFELLFKKTYLPRFYSNQYAITREALRTTRYRVFENRVRQRGIAVNRTIYEKAVGLLNGAFGTTNAENTGADTKALCATDHPLEPNSSSTQSNKGTSALSQAAVIAAQEAMMLWTDHKGKPITVMGDTLIVPVALKAEAEVIVRSTALPGSANNDVNIVQGLNLIVSKYLTDTTNWFLVDSQLAKSLVNWYWVERPDYAINPANNYDLLTYERVYMGWMLGFDDWRWVYGSEVT